jgi:T5SS/PEP-CTERM-associated repeat protein
LKLTVPAHLQPKNRTSAQNLGLINGRNCAATGVRRIPQSWGFLLFRAVGIQFVLQPQYDPLLWGVLATFGLFESPLAVAGNGRDSFPFGESSMRSAASLILCGRWVLSHLVIPAALLAFIPPAKISRADTLTWKDPITGSWSTGANWCCKTSPPPENAPLPPAANDDARIHNGGVAQLLLENASVIGVHLGQYQGNSGTIEVYGGQLTTSHVNVGDFDTDPLTGGSGTIRLIEGGRWVNRSSMYVGYGGNGLVEIKGGELRTPSSGFFSFDYAYNLGILLGSVGTVVVEDRNSMNGILATQFDIQVGDQGTGYLTVINGGEVQVRDLYVAEDPESIANIVTVAGANSSMQISGTLVLGQAGAGTLEVKEDASISSNLAQINPLSSATIDHASWQSTGSITTFGDLTVRNGAVVVSPNIQIYNKDTSVDTQSFLIAESNLTVSGNGELSIDGQSTIVVSNEHNSVPGVHGLYVGNLTGRGDFFVQSGGKYHGQGALIDGLAGTRATVQVNGQWLESRGVVVGGDAFGELHVLNGGIADFDVEPFGDLMVGGRDTSDGNVIVTNGRLETNHFILGYEGLGRMTVSGGGVVTSDSASIGGEPSGRGQAVVTGAGSKWEIGGNLRMGVRNNSSLRIDEGAKVLVGTNTDGHVSIGSAPGDELLTSNVTVDGTGSELNVFGDLIVGDYGFASLDVKNDALVINDHGWIAYNTGSGGDVVVDNATWASRNSVIVGLSGTGSLDIRNNGIVIAKEQMIVGPLGTLQGNGTVTGDGTITFVQNQGIVAPASPAPNGAGGDMGGAGSNSPGMLTVDGNFTQTSTGKLQLDFASPASYDVLNVSGQVNLGGTVEILLADGYIPSPSDTFQVISAPAISGNFNVSARTHSGITGAFDFNITPTGLALSNFQPGVDPSLIAHWDAESGAADVTGNGHDGTFIGNAATTPDGPFGNAFSLDGNGDYINVGDELDMGASDYTLSAWVKGDPTMNGWARIFDKGHASGYELGRTDHSPAIGATHLNSNAFLSSSTDLIDNTWHHVTVVKDGNTLTVYADGIAQNTDIASAAPQGNSLPLYIGFNPGEGFPGYWKGQLDELKVHNRALSHAEVAALAGTNNNGPIAYWNAENGAADATGNGHDGTYFGNATTTTDGPNGKAFTFDGSGDFISIGDELDLGTTDFTFAAWVKGDPTMDQWARIIDKGYSSGYSLHRRGGTNEIGFELINSGSQGNSFATDTALIDNTWHHVAVVKDGTTVTIYADGVAENSETVSGAPQATWIPLLIGYNPGEGTQGFWKGMLDEIMIFNRTLTPAEIAALAVVPTVIDGDFNLDGAVDAADYVMWRKTGGSQPGYNTWRTHFGESGGNGTSTDAAVPEPSAIILALVATACAFTKTSTTARDARSSFRFSVRVAGSPGAR